MDAPLSANPGRFLIFGRDGCPYTQRTVRFFDRFMKSSAAPELFLYVDLLSAEGPLYGPGTPDSLPVQMYPALVEHLCVQHGSNILTVPQVFIGDAFYGDSQTTLRVPSYYTSHPYYTPCRLFCKLVSRERGDVIMDGELRQTVRAFVADNLQSHYGPACLEWFDSLPAGELGQMIRT